jgi:hypothetical protein
VWFIITRSGCGDRRHSAQSKYGCPLSLGTTDPQMTAIVDKFNELIAALTR